MCDCYNCGEKVVLLKTTLHHNVPFFGNHVHLMEVEATERIVHVVGDIAKEVEAPISPPVAIQSLNTCMVVVWITNPTTEQRGKGRNAPTITPTHNTVRSMLLLPKLERKQQQQHHQYRLLGLKQHQPTLL
eukprot:1313484-Ditylum_brightwellii.AAC.1